MKSVKCISFCFELKMICITRLKRKIFFEALNTVKFWPNLQHQFDAANGYGTTRLHTQLIQGVSTPNLFTQCSYHRNIFYTKIEKNLFWLFSTKSSLEIWITISNFTSVSPSVSLWVSLSHFTISNSCNCITKCD